MIISIIVAVAKNNAIGKNNQLLWHLPSDMKFFRERTTGHCVLTGRKNYESIPEKFRPLPNRTNIVVTTQKTYNAPGAHVFGSIEEGIEFARGKNETELFIIGGGEIYRQVMEKHLVHKLYITFIEGDFEADTFFPEIDCTRWTELSRTRVEADEKNKLAHCFVEFLRKS